MNENESGKGPDPSSGSGPAPEEPIFRFEKKVDDDWKRKVEEEKERLSEPPRRERPARPEPPRGARGPAAAEPPREPPDEPLEEEEADRAAAATPFLRFVGDLANQALTALGVYPDPMTRTRQVSLEQARYIIEVLRVLKDKTKGNLTPDEQRVVDGLVYELQLQYVEMSR
jgi:hypothetical protein